MQYLLPVTNSCQCLRARRPLRRGRAGVSLLEVMFSIGVVTIGLVGIAALLPVAGAQANKGAGADASARLGAAAIREFHACSMDNPAAWRWYDGTQFRRPTVAEMTAGFSFCLDPRFVGQGGVIPDHVRRNGFPYIDDLYGSGTILSMPRITLTPSPTMPVTAAMTRLQADRLFLSDDSLVFDLPEDRTLGPVQNFNLSASNLPLRRNATGTLSWMATIVPRLDRVRYVDASGVLLTDEYTDEYTLSVVVFSRRIIDATLTNEDRASERVVMVNAFYCGQPAVGGGDMQLVSRRNSADDLLLRAGDWVMLSGWKLVDVRSIVSGSTVSTSRVQVHKWYRVVNAGDAPLNNGTAWTRDVTLIGPDWDWQGLDSNTQVTIVRGAVAVFEKTIRLETSSLWTN